MHRDAKSPVQSHTAGWWCWDSQFSCLLCIQGLSRVTSAFPGQLGNTPRLVLNQHTEVWSIQHSRSPSMELRFYSEHTASKEIDTYMTSCQDGKGRGSGDRVTQGTEPMEQASVLCPVNSQPTVQRRRPEHPDNSGQTLARKISSQITCSLWHTAARWLLPFLPMSPCSLNRWSQPLIPGVLLVK